MALVIAVAASASAAGRHHGKRWYRDRWCAKNFSGSGFSLGRHDDCLTGTYLIEFDYADHWYESIGESLYHAMRAGKKAGIVLIMERPRDNAYWERLNNTIRFYRLPITTWNTAP